MTRLARSAFAIVFVSGCGTTASPASPAASGSAVADAPSASTSPPTPSAAASAVTPVGVGALDWARALPGTRRCPAPDEDVIVECERGGTASCWKLIHALGKPRCNGAGDVGRYRLWEQLCATTPDARNCGALGEALTTRLVPPHGAPDKKRAVEVLVGACDLARGPKGDRLEVVYVCDRASYRLREEGDDRWLAYAKYACAASSVASCLRVAGLLPPPERLKALVEACDHPFSGRGDGDPVAACYDAALLARTPDLADGALANRMMAAAKKGALDCTITGYHDTCPTLQKFPAADWPKAPKGVPYPTQPYWLQCESTSDPDACAVAFVDTFASDEEMFELAFVAELAMGKLPPIGNAWWAARPWAFYARNTLAGWPAKSGEAPGPAFPTDAETAIYMAKQACWIDDAACDVLGDVLRATGGQVQDIDDANRRACAAGTKRACTERKTR